MEVKAEFENFYDVEADALVVMIYEGEKADDGRAEGVGRAHGRHDERAAGERRDARQAGRYGLCPPPRKHSRAPPAAGRRGQARRLLLRHRARAWRAPPRGSCAARGARTMAILRRSQLDLGKSAQAAVEGALLGLFEPDMYKTENKEERRIDELILVAAAPRLGEALARGVERGRIIGEAVNFARELSTSRAPRSRPRSLPSGPRKRPTRFGLEIDVLDEARMKELGHGGAARRRARVGRAGQADRAALHARRGASRWAMTRCHRDSRQGHHLRLRRHLDQAGRGHGEDEVRHVGRAPRRSRRCAPSPSSSRASTSSASCPTTENMPSGRAYKPGRRAARDERQDDRGHQHRRRGPADPGRRDPYARKLGATRIIDLATLTGRGLDRARRLSTSPYWATTRR